MIAHFFDIETLIRVNNNVWIISNEKPNIPLIKISESEFNTIKKGVYRKYNSPLVINGDRFWFPENLYNELKIKTKKHNVGFDTLSFSLQEYMNDSIIKHLKFDIFNNHFSHLKNKNDDIYIVCSKKNKQSYQPIIDKLEEELEKIGLIIKHYYFISETFYNRDKDEIAYKKVRLALQHLIGLKTDGNQFTDGEITKYDNVYYYSSNKKTIDLLNRADTLFSNFTESSSDIVKEKIKEISQKYDNLLIVREVTFNEVNLFNEKEIQLEYTYIKKYFESNLINLKSFSSFVKTYEQMKIIK